ncbi:hypothetical protein V1505DRAFT_372276 [Lipomyces doorenjongii]
MSPGAPDVSHWVSPSNSLVTPSTARGMVKINGSNYNQWAMYIEALMYSEESGMSSVVLGEYTQPSSKMQLLSRRRITLHTLT